MVAVAALVALAAGDLSSQAPGRNAVSGIVVDAISGKPVAGAIVSAQQLPADSSVIPVVQSYMTFNGLVGFFEPVMTDSAGRFTIGGLPDGAFEFEATKDGWHYGAVGQRSPGAPSQWVELRGAVPTNGVRIAMWRAATLSGRVSDEHGRPRSGITVTAFRDDSSADAAALASQTDDLGEFEIQVVPGRYLVGVVMPVALNARVPRASTVDGRRRVYQTRFYPAAPSPATALAIEVGPAGHRANIDVILDAVPAFGISGVATHSRLNGGARITLSRRDSHVPSDAVVAPGPGGAFRFDGVPPGEYVVSVYQEPAMPYMSHGIAPLEQLPSEPTLFAEKAITIRDRDEQVALEPRPGATIQGTVVFRGGSALPSSAEQAQRVIGASEASGREFDIRGKFVPPDRWSTIQMPPGRYTLWAGASKGWWLESIVASGRDVSNEPLTIGTADVTGVIVTFTDTLGAVSGRVTSARSRTRQWVLLFPAEAPAWPERPRNTPRIRIVSVGTAGTFAASLPQGQYLGVALDRAPVDVSVAALTRLAPHGTRFVVAGTTPVAVTLQARQVQ